MAERHIRIQSLRHIAAKQAIDDGVDIRELFNDPTILQPLYDAIKGTRTFDNPNLFHFERFDYDIDMKTIIINLYSYAFKTACIYRPEDVIDGIRKYGYHENLDAKNLVIAAINECITDESDKARMHYIIGNASGYRASDIIIHNGADRDALTYYAALRGDIPLLQQLNYNFKPSNAKLQDILSVFIRNGSIEGVRYVHELSPYIALRDDACIDAATRGLIEILKELHTLGLLDKYHAATILTKCKKISLDIIKYLLSIGAKFVDIMSHDYKLRSYVLRNAVINDDIAVIEYLLGYEAFHNAEVNKDYELAIERGNMDIIRIFVDCHKPSILTKYYVPAACKHGRIYVLKYILDKGGELSSITASDMQGITKKKYYAMLVFVIDSGLDISKYAHTLLHTAVADNALDICHYLLKHGTSYGSLSVKDTSRAINNGYYALAMEILEANSYIQYDYDELIVAIFESENSALLDYILQRGANFINSGSLLLYRAIRRGSHTQVEYLIKHGVPVDSRGNSCILECLKSEHTSMVDYFIGQGCDVHYEKEAPLMMCIQKGYVDAFKSLVNAGADIEVLKGEVIVGGTETSRYELAKFIISRGLRVKLIPVFAHHYTSNNILVQQPALLLQPI